MKALFSSHVNEILSHPREPVSCKQGAPDNENKNSIANQFVFAVDVAVSLLGQGNQQVIYYRKKQPILKSRN